jgi:hypothetical protein
LIPSREGPCAASSTSPTPRSLIDDEYMDAALAEPKILLTSSHNPSQPLTWFAKGCLSKCTKDEPWRALLSPAVHITSLILSWS